jgi:sugar phosphate isomerase/epimerase
MISRRNMLKFSAAGTFVAGLPAFSLAKSNSPQIGVALQLYSVRQDCGTDFDKALEQVAKLGFDAVEFAGYYKYGNNPATLKQRLDDLGLKVAGTHIGADSLTPNKIKKTIDFHKAIGCRNLVVPSDKRFGDPLKSQELVDLMNQAAETLKPENMRCGYHNHAGEFQGEIGSTPWDIFAQRTSKEVILQQDVGWSTAARKDPAEYVRKYPGRTLSAHFKPTVLKSEEKIPILGQDSVKWNDIITACREVGGTEWFVIEQEKYLKDKSPMECSGLSFQGLKKILAEMGKQ